MLTRSSFIWTLSLIAIAICSNYAVNAAPKIGTTAAVSGNVLVSTNGAARKAQVRDNIKLRDRVLTKEDSALQILLLDQSTFTVGQNCDMLIDKFVYDPSTSAGKVSAKVTKGAFRFMSGRIGKKNFADVAVSTPSATIGIRGTIFEGIVGEDAVALAGLGGINTRGARNSEASVIILRGPGRSRNTFDRPGRIDVTNSRGTVRISQPDHAVFVGSRGTSPVGPFRVTDEMHDYLNFFLRSAPNGESESPAEIVESASDLAGQSKFETPIIPIDPFIEEVHSGISDSNSERNIDPVDPVTPVTPVDPVDPVTPVDPYGPNTP